MEAGVAEGGADAVAGLEHGGVAEPDHGDRGEPAADVDLDAHRVGDQADQRGGRQPGEHRSEDPLEVVDRRPQADRLQPVIGQQGEPMTVDHERDQGIQAGQQPAVVGWHGGSFQNLRLAGRTEPYTPHLAPEGGRADLWTSRRAGRTGEGGDRAVYATGEPLPAGGVAGTITDAERRGPREDGS